MNPVASLVILVKLSLYSTVQYKRKMGSSTKLRLVGKEWIELKRQKEAGDRRPITAGHHPGWSGNWQVLLRNQQPKGEASIVFCDSSSDYNTLLYYLKFIIVALHRYCTLVYILLFYSIEYKIVSMDSIKKKLLFLLTA